MTRAMYAKKKDDILRPFPGCATINIVWCDLIYAHFLPIVKAKLCHSWTLWEGQYYVRLGRLLINYDIAWNVCKGVRTEAKF